MRKYRGYIICLLSGILLASAVPTYGAVSSLVGKKVGGEIIVNLNNNEVGSAIVVDGRSYLPVRAAAVALGLELEVTKEAINLVSDTPVVEQSTNNNNVSLEVSIQVFERSKNVAITKRDRINAILTKPNIKLERAKELLATMTEGHPHRQTQLEVVATFETAKVDNEQSVIDLQSEIDGYDQLIKGLQDQLNVLEAK